MWRAIALALVGYWFGAREGERRALTRLASLGIECRPHEGRFRTLPNGRRIYDDTAPGWNAAPRHAVVPRSKSGGLAFIVFAAFGLSVLWTAHLLVNAFLILSGLILFFVGLALLGFWRSCAVLVFGGLLLAHAKADPPLFQPLFHGTLYGCNGPDRASRHASCNAIVPRLCKQIPLANTPTSRRV